MSDKSANGVVGVTFGLILLLLLLVGGVGIYYLIERQKVAVAVAMATEGAQLNEAQAGAEVERVRSEAAAQFASREEAGDNERSPAQDDAIRAAVKSVLHTQEEAWNRGDVDAFMEHYWKSDDLTFSSGGKTTRGWNATRDRYREKYPTRDKMGRVSFSGLEITPLGDSAALVIGQWKLDRESEAVGSNFSIVFRKIDGRWVIVHDHTSRLVE